MSTSRDRWLAVTYAATIFVSAFLLFQIQPLVSKRILPWFGGSSAVWTTCVLFFQTLLFFGYAYAHASNTWLRPRYQALVHVGMIVFALALLPVLPRDSWEPVGDEPPVAQILLTLLVSVGLPYFVLSATGPLLQAWFARSFPGRVPYRLYALSNVGSLLALVSYPFFFEPTFDLPTQARYWTCGFITYAALCVYTAWRIGISEKTSVSGKGQGESDYASAQSSTLQASSPSGTEIVAPRFHHYLLWLALTAFASVVLLATTNHVSTDMASMPLLWIGPLALYLLTFIIAFDRPGLYVRIPFALLALGSIFTTALVHNVKLGTAELAELGTPGSLISKLLSRFTTPPTIEITSWHFLAVNFVTVFAVCMVCHGELVRLRPATRYLTAFYLMVAAGGALGGALVTLVAPYVFVTYLEWELSLWIGAVLAIIVLGCGCAEWLDNIHRRDPWKYMVVGATALASLLGLIDLSAFLQVDNDGVQWRDRNFFGTLKVELREPEDEEMQKFVLLNGFITHGMQFTDESRHREATSYYGSQSGVGREIEYYHQQLPAGQLRLGVVGLGTGTTAVYPEPGESITFYDINPMVIDMVEQGRWFTHVLDCRARGARCDIRLGDARLILRHKLERNQTGRYHVLALDAFSSDAIPIHLLTTQAFEVYLGNLSGANAAAGSRDQVGCIAVHISNRYMDLEPIVRGIAERFKLHAIRIEDDDDDPNGVYVSEWIVVTPNAELAAALKEFENPADSKKPAVLWTDTKSAVFFEVLQ